MALQAPGLRHDSANLADEPVGSSPRHLNALITRQRPDKSGSATTSLIDSETVDLQPAEQFGLFRSFAKTTLKLSGRSSPLGGG